MKGIAKRAATIFLALAVIFTFTPFIGDATGGVAGAQEVYADDSLGNLQNVQISPDGVLSLDAYDGAAKYKVTFVDEYYSFSFTDTVFDLCAKMKSAGFTSGDYRLRVVALNAAGVEITNPVELTYNGYYHPSLDKATNLRWDGSTARWDPVEHASYYVIYVMKKGLPNYADTLEFYGSVDGTFFDCSKTITDTERQYYFYVYASDSDSEYASSQSDDSPLTYGIAYPYRDIANLRLVNGVLSWDAYSGAADYKISIEVTPGNFYSDTVYGTTLDLWAFCKQSALPSGDYPYKLFARDEDGYRISNEMTGTYMGFINETLSMPVHLRWDGKTAKWDAVSHADYYQVNLYKNHVYVASETTEDTQFDFSDYIISTASTYTFSVRALDSSNDYGSSEWAESGEAGFIYGLTATADPSTFYYDGTEHKPTVIVKDSDGNELAEGTDYELTFPTDCYSAGTKQITITGIGLYSGTMTAEYVITGRNIADAEVAAIPDQPYNGSVYVPVPEVSYYGSQLTEGDDYTYVLQNSSGNTVIPKDAGTYRVVITGKGNYVGTNRVSFMITQIDLSAAVISGISDKTYTGAAIIQTPTIKYDGAALTEGTDYSISYKDNTGNAVASPINIGTYKVVITGKGNYTGTVEEPFTISKKAITPKITLSKSYYFYNSSNDRKPAVTVYDGTTKLASTDYTVTWPKDVRSAGKKTVTVTLKGNYSGKNTATYTIFKPTVKLSKTAYVYSGKSQKPTISVYNGSTKIGSANYTVTWPSNTTSVGKKSVKITMTGKYSGTKTVTYKINPKGTSISGVSAVSKGFTVKWKKQATQTTGYQIYYTTSSTKPKATTKPKVTISKTGTVSKKVTGLKGGKKYYVYVRTYKTVDGVKYYSAWSKAKTVTTKK